MKNTFKAPQKNLKSSWASVSYTKPKYSGPTIKRSLSSRPTAIIKDRGSFVSNQPSNHSNMY